MKHLKVHGFFCESDWKSLKLNATVMRLNYHRYRCIIKRKDLAQKAFRFFTYLFNLLFQHFRKKIWSLGASLWQRRITNLNVLLNDLRSHCFKPILHYIKTSIAWDHTINAFNVEIKCWCYNFLNKLITMFLILLEAKQWLS